MSASGLAEPLARWSLPRRVAFRFVFCYFVLYDFPSPIDAVPDIGPFAELVTNTWARLVQPVAEAIFGVSADVLPNGSGDTTFNYVQIFVIAVLAAIATIAWSILDRNRPHYQRLAEWFRVYLRFVVGVAMISYGAFKVIKAQFPSASLDRLLEPYGDASPMGLLWTFMGASALYNFFTGAGEMLGGLLLFARRTQLLGALITAAVMTHVAVLNFSYDVPVKLYSLHLLAQALYIAAPDAKRLVQFFLARSSSPPLIQRAWLRRTVTALAAIGVVAYSALALKESYDANREYGDMSKRSPLRGIWNVDEYVIDGQVHPPLITDATRWRRVVIDGPRIVSIHLMNDTRERYLAGLTGETLTLTRRDGPASKFTVRRPDNDTLIFEGTLDAHPIRATMRRDPREFQLLTRGFHWINEYPFNR